MDLSLDFVHKIDSKTFPIQFAFDFGILHGIC